MEDKFMRREFLRRAGIVGAAACGLGLGGNQLLGFLGEAEAAAKPILAVASTGNVETLVKKAIDALGGISKFVKSGSSVVIKPNLAWARTPEQAANTNPEVISALIKLCKGAGAKRITVIEHSCDSSNIAFEMSGAKAVCDSAGVRLISADRENMYKTISIPKGKVLKSEKFLIEALNADVFINVPIAKVHGSAAITASMKNLMGAIWDRQRWHSANLDQCIADFSTAVHPNLIVLDATRILLTQGPKGPGRTKELGEVIASTDPVAVDAYAATILGKNPAEIKSIVCADALGVGVMDLKKVILKRV